MTTLIHLFTSKNMLRHRWKNPVRLLLISGAILIPLLFGCAMLPRRLLFHPTRLNADSPELTEWPGDDGRPLGYARVVSNPRNVWLLLHGNAGQACDRSYALNSFSAEDSVYIMEYPGYGLREGAPSKSSFNQAAVEAYHNLRRAFPGRPVCVAGESIGSGPACALALESPPPDKIALVVPFDRLDRVAARHVPFLPVRLLLLGNNWDNIRSLRLYPGPVDIFAAREDSIIPAEHAEALAQANPSAKLHVIDGGHNDWPLQREVRFRHP